MYWGWERQDEKTKGDDGLERRQDGTDRGMTADREKNTNRGAGWTEEETIKHIFSEKNA